MDQRRHILQEMSMLMLFFTTVFCIFLCPQTCTGSLSEVSKHGGDVEVLGSTSALAPASDPHRNKTGTGAASPSSKGISTKANAKPLASAITGQSWCVAMNSIPDQTLQTALDYACGVGGADCGPIQQGGVCFEPNNLFSHASYAFNSYYQKSGMGAGTCDFGGAAATTPTDPSYANCQYPLSGGLSLTNTTTGTPGTSVGFVPPYVPTNGAYSITINLELLLSLSSLLVAVIVFSDQF